MTDQLRQATLNVVSLLRQRGDLLSINAATLMRELLRQNSDLEARIDLMAQAAKALEDQIYTSAPRLIATD